LALGFNKLCYGILGGNRDTFELLMLPNPGYAILRILFYAVHSTVKCYYIVLGIAILCVSEESPRSIEAK
jgi:hypothetical protein